MREDSKHMQNILEVYGYVNEKLSKQKIASFVDFIKTQLNFDISDFIDLQHSKRDYINIDTHRLSDGIMRQLKQLENSYGKNIFRIGDNGGLGHTFHLAKDFDPKNNK
jgi:hypothetical protein